MSFRRILRAAVLGVACWGMVAPQSMTMAGENTRTSASQLADVSLAEGGVLRGKVVDSQGKPVAGAAVTLGFAGHVVARTSTRQDGSYAVKGLRGGLHQLVAGADASMVRLWTPGTAPAAAQTTALTVAGQTIRGQYAEYTDGGEYCPPGGVVTTQYAPPVSGGFGMLDVVTLATVGTSVAALVYGIDNNNKLDDLEDKLASP